MPPPPLKLHPRRLTPCHLHPSEPLTSLCAPCLHQRLSILTPELRRCKTFSADKCESLALSHEPRRRSCEVRARNSLEDLLTLDDKRAVESNNLGLIELREEQEEEDEVEKTDCEIRVSNAVRFRDSDLEDEDSRTMKELIDLEFHNKPVKKDFKEIAGSFWIAASVFSKKLRKWKGKQKSRLGEMRLEDLKGRRLRDVQQESGRRSCDTDPRFSIDLGRASMDGGRISVDGIGKRFFDTDPLFSLDLGRASVDCGRIAVEESTFEAPRASWDGYVNGRMLPRNTTTPMVSVIENAMATVYGFEDKKSYGSVSMHMGRKSVDGCSAKTGEIEIVHGPKLLITEKELMSSRMSSLKDDSSDSFDTASKDMTSSASSSSTGVGSRNSKKWRKLLNVLSILSRQKQCKSAHDEECSKEVKEGNEEEVSSNSNWKLTRSNSVVAGSALGMKKTEAGVLERNRSARFPGNNTQNGMLRFYLTPLRSAKRNKFGKNNKLNGCHSSGRSVLKL